MSHLCVLHHLYLQVMGRTLSRTYQQSNLVCITRLYPRSNLLLNGYLMGPYDQQHSHPSVSPTKHRRVAPLPFVCSSR